MSQFLISLHGTAAKTLKYWSGVQCQTRGLFGQCRTGGLAVTKQALKPGLSNPFWVPSAGYVVYPNDLVFDTEISGGITSAKVITIKGIPQTGCKTIIVTIETTREEHADILFHMKASLEEKVLYINKRIDGQFDDPKVHKTRFPFSVGEPFTLSIHLSPENFKLVINNVSIDTLKHNINHHLRAHQFSYLRVVGQLDVSQYLLEQN
ncbi:galectin-3-like [Physella acuta]|uniref:galectin-3-like n=1 Tax=Physella acuta TaxID=109671 RepID=UPI0027DE8494|nr:galectin-3-like [Physella acuta]